MMQKFKVACTASWAVSLIIENKQTFSSQSGWWYGIGYGPERERWTCTYTRVYNMYEPLSRFIIFKYQSQ